MMLFKDDWLDKWIEIMRLETDPVRFAGLLDTMKFDLMRALESAENKIVEEGQNATMHAMRSSNAPG